MPKTRATALRAVLFTDLVGSTELAGELGDERWARLLAAQRRIIREEIRARRGREVDTAGDGFFAVFEGPADAVRCAFVAARRVQAIGVDQRAGVHFGEIETSGGDAHGIVVHTGARIMAKAGAAEVLVSQTVRDLVAGATFELVERGEFDLKGVPGTWRLFDVVKVDGDERPSPLGADAAELRLHASVPERPRRRGPVVAGLSLGALVIVAAAWFLLRPSPVFVPAAGTVARISDRRFERPIDVGTFPVALAEGAGRVWVADGRSLLYWVDERTGEVSSRGMEGSPTGVAVGDGSVWITAAFGSSGDAGASVSRLDPASGEVAAAFDTPIDSQAITSGGGDVWVADPNTDSITRFDPISRRPDAFALPGADAAARPDSIAFGEVGAPAVWVGDSLSGNVFRVDARDPRSIRTFTVGGPVSGLAVGSDAVFVSSEFKDTVYAIDPDTGAIRSTVDVGAHGCNGPTSLAAGADGVWVTCSLSSRVVLIDPANGAVISSLPVGATPVSITSAADGSVWVAVEPR